MSIQNVLEQLLRSGQQQYRQASESGDLTKYGTGAAVGGALALWPFIDQMNPAADPLALKEVEFDLTPLVRP